MRVFAFVVDVFVLALVLFMVRSETPIPMFSETWWLTVLIGGFAGSYVVARVSGSSFTRWAKLAWFDIPARLQFALAYALYFGVINATSWVFQRVLRISAVEHLNFQFLRDFRVWSLTNTEFETFADFKAGRVSSLPVCPNCGTRHEPHNNLADLLQMLAKDLLGDEAGAPEGLGITSIPVINKNAN